jgi:hypothetical protein
LVLGIGAVAVIGFLNQPPPRTRTSPISLSTPTATPVVLTSAWQTITTAGGYYLRLPPTWTVRPDFPGAGNFFAEYVPARGGPPVPLSPGDVPPQEAEVDVTVSSPPQPQPASLGTPFCVGSVCGQRLQGTPRWVCSDPACVEQLLAQPYQVNIELVKGGRLYQLHATIGGPPSAIERNAETVEAIIRSFAFVD